ncbi:MAG: hypothetical protein JWN70_2280 [Planctomycetaceae bacterium]|nr:hypothetical protein [Planctomycetaceae bacterium]
MSVNNSNSLYFFVSFVTFCSKGIGTEGHKGHDVLKDSQVEASCRGFRQLDW